MIGPLTIRPASPVMPSFVLGYNQNAIAGKYGRDMTEGFDINDFDIVFDRAKAGGGSIVRIWLFEDCIKEGIDFGRDGKKPLGLRRDFLQNIYKIMQRAQSKQVKIYWTALSGNWREEWNDRDNRRWRQIHYNILNNRFQSNDDFLFNCLRPIIEEVLNRDEFRPFIYGFDVMNEFQGSERFWPDPWIDNACAWIRTTCNVIRTYANWRLPLTVSAQGKGAGDSFNGSDCIMDYLRDLPLDFYDLHQYNDEGTIHRVNDLKDLARQTGKKIILGEFGQRTHRYRNAIKNRSTRNFLANAYHGGFSGAIAWKLMEKDEEDPDKVFHTFYRNGVERPAVAIVREFARNASTHSAQGG